MDGGDNAGGDGVFLVNTGEATFVETKPGADAAVRFRASSRGVVRVTVNGSSDASPPQATASYACSIGIHEA